MIKPLDALDALGELDSALEEFGDEPAFARTTTTKNRTMPVRSHASTNYGRRRFGSKRSNIKVGMRRRYNKKVLHTD